MTTINAPSDFTGTSYIGPLILPFKDGVATYDGDLNDGTRTYLESMGYGIDSDAKPFEAPALLTDLNGAPVDTRDTADVLAASPLRDAAVDPQPEDFLPPVNAGQADPHGPEVVAPGIHAVPPKPIHPGPVGAAGPLEGKDTPEHPSVVKNTDAQAANETNLAQAVLVDQQQVQAATAAAAQVDPVNTDATVGAYDPGQYTVDEVNEYLASADETERERVLAAERAGKARKGVLGE